MIKAEKYLIQIIVVAIMLVLVETMAAQDIHRELIAGPPRDCENNNLVLESASWEAGKDSVLLLVSILGKNDRKPEIGYRRLYTARAYLTEYTKLRTSANVVIAEARRKDYSFADGGIAIYVKGKLFEILTSESDGDLRVGVCSYPVVLDKEERAQDAILYPWNYRSKRNIPKRR